MVHAATKTKRPVKKRRRAALSFRPLTPKLMDQLGAVLRDSWGSSCWCLFPRLTHTQMKALPGEGSYNQRQRAEMTRLARRKHAPGLLAFEGEKPVGWVAVAPRQEYGRITSSRTTPPVDDEAVWVIPCITVHAGERGRGVAVALIRAAVAYAGQCGAPMVEAYPREGDERLSDGSVFFGTEAMFRRAGFRVVREVDNTQPKAWVRRVAMRAKPKGRRG